MSQSNLHDAEQQQFVDPNGSYKFNYTPPDDLGGMKYVVAQLCTDVSGSTFDFTANLKTLAQNVVRGLQLSPVADMVLLRHVEFSSDFKEIHGFVPVTSLKPDNFKEPVANGGTRLYDVTLEGLTVLQNYSQTLVDQDFEAVPVLFVITDGEDSPLDDRVLKQIAAKKHEMLVSEQFSDVITVLLGIGSPSNNRLKKYMEDFKKSGNFNHLEYVTDASPEKLGKLVGLIVSTSVSASQSVRPASSQATGTTII